MLVLLLTFQLCVIDLSSSITIENMYTGLNIEVEDTNPRSIINFTKETYYKYHDFADLFA